MYSDNFQQCRKIIVYIEWKCYGKPSNSPWNKGMEREMIVAMLYRTEESDISNWFRMTKKDNIKTLIFIQNTKIKSPMNGMIFILKLKITYDGKELP